MLSRVPTAYKNRVLSSVSASEIEGLQQHLSYVSLTAEQVLHEPNSRITDIYFVEEGVVSLTADTFDEGHVEVGLIGREGFVGSSVALNDKPISLHRAFVQVPGFACKMSSTALRSAMDQSATFRQSCLRSVEMLMLHTSQVAACNTRHPLPERLARWLLMVRERIDSDDVPMTQSFLSMMLGVRRPGVTVAAATLQAGGLIRQARGYITVADYDGLLAASCQCYRVIASNQRRILQGEVQDSVA
jgi:CRP-like cAMP-binding protein